MGWQHKALRNSLHNSHAKAQPWSMLTAHRFMACHATAKVLGGREGLAAARRCANKRAGGGRGACQSSQATGQKTIEANSKTL